MLKFFAGLTAGAVVICAACDRRPPLPITPSWLKTDAGESRVWLSCSADGGEHWHRVTRAWGPGEGLRAAYQSPDCRGGESIIIRWEMEP